MTIVKPKIFTKKKMIRKRPRGQPRQRWSDSVENDLQELGITKWERDDQRQSRMLYYL
jgi:hypothetical protein